MNAATVSAAAALVRSKIGIVVAGRIDQSSESERLILWPVDLHANEAFTLVLDLGWRSADVVLELGDYAGAILRSIAQASDEAKFTSRTFIDAMRNGGIHVKVEVNGAECDFRSALPAEIKSIAFAVRQRAIIFDPDSEADILGLVDSLMVPSFGIFTSLIGVVEVEPESEGVAEGAPYQALVTRYERKRVNREACLRTYPPICRACHFDFGDFYGAVGKDFIEIHHVESLADIAKEHSIDPAKDLVPLCSNCHSMAHRKSPPHTVEELQQMIERSAK